MHRFLVFLFLLLTVCVKAQYTTEIKQRIKNLRELAYSDSLGLFSEGQKIIDQVRGTKQEGAIADVYLYYGNYFYYVRNIDRARHYFTTANKQAILTKNQHIEDLSNVRLIFIDNEEGINDDAVNELNEMRKARQQRDTTIISMQNQNYLSLKDAKEIWQNMKKFLEKQAKKKKVSTAFNLI